jgi:hypothetical protein
MKQALGMSAVLVGTLLTGACATSKPVPQEPTPSQPAAGSDEGKTQTKESIVIVNVSDYVGKAVGAALEAFQGENGAGVRFQGKATGKATIEVPLGVQDPSQLRYLQIRAEGSSQKAGSKEVYLVSADLFAQTSKTETLLLGNVATTSTPAGFGIQIRSAQTVPPKGIGKTSSCFARITLNRSGQTFNPVIHEIYVQTGDDRCQPPPAAVVGCSQGVKIVWCPPGPRDCGPPKLP